MVKNPPASAGDARDVGSVPGPGRSLREGNGYLLQYSCLENPRDRGAWQATVHGIAKSQMSMHALHTHTHTHTHTHSSLQKSEGQLHNASLEAPEKPEATQTATALLSLSSGRLLHQTLDSVVCSQP